MRVRTESQFIDFEWDVSPNGYDVVEGQVLLVAGGWDKATPILWAPPPSVPTACPKRYRPLKSHTGLFLTFANTPANEEGVRAFANEFGALGVWATVMVRLPDVRPEPFPAQGEPLSEWQLQIETMRNAVRLWHLARA